MKKHALGALLVGLVACGGGDGKDPTTVVVPDSGGADSAPETCNPLSQTGCQSGEKCTWIIDQDQPRIGHVGCAPEGAGQLGDSCTYGPAGANGYDNCDVGLACLAGVCKSLCSLDGGTPACPATDSCSRYGNFYAIGGEEVAGVCDPLCDPLTQRLKDANNTEACGSPMPAMPVSGCYGFTDFSCVPAGDATLTNRQPAETSPSGDAYLNGCAAGFIPLWNESSTSTTVICSGYCAPLETDMTQPNNAIGDAAALAKLPADPAPVAGHGTCSAANKGSGAASSCRYFWWLLEDENGALPPEFLPGYVDTLGFCFEAANYTWDHDMMQATPEVPLPDCKTLSKADAMMWGCQKRVAPFAGEKHAPNPLRPLVRTQLDGELPVLRHTFN